MGRYMSVIELFSPSKLGGVGKGRTRHSCVIRSISVVPEVESPLIGDRTMVASVRCKAMRDGILVESGGLVREIAKEEKL